MKKILLINAFLGLTACGTETKNSLVKDHVVTTESGDYIVVFENPETSKLSMAKCKLDDMIALESMYQDYDQLSAAKKMSVWKKSKSNLCHTAAPNSISIDKKTYLEKLFKVIEIDIENENSLAIKTQLATSTLLDRIAKLDSKQDSLLLELVDNEKEIEKIMSMLPELEDQISSLDVAIKYLQNKLSTATGSESSDQLALLRKQLEEKKAIAASIKEEITKLNSNIAALKKANTSEIPKLIQALQSDSKLLKTKIVNLDEKFKIDMQQIKQKRNSLIEQLNPGKFDISSVNASLFSRVLNQVFSAHAPKKVAVFSNQISYYSLDSANGKIVDHSYFIAPSYEQGMVLKGNLTRENQFYLSLGDDFTKAFNQIDVIYGSIEKNDILYMIYSEKSTLTNPKKDLKITAINVSASAKFGTMIWDKTITSLEGSHKGSQLLFINDKIGVIVNGSVWAFETKDGLFAWKTSEANCKYNLFTNDGRFLCSTFGLKSSLYLGETGDTLWTIDRLNIIAVEQASQNYLYFEKQESDGFLPDQYNVSVYGKEHGDLVSTKKGFRNIFAIAENRGIVYFVADNGLWMFKENTFQLISNQIKFNSFEGKIYFKNDTIILATDKGFYTYTDFGLKSKAEFASSQFGKPISNVNECFMYRNINSLYCLDQNGTKKWDTAFTSIDLEFISNINIFEKI